MPPYATRLSEIEPFKVMKLLARANELGSSGREIVHMEVGEPDFETPAAIVEAGRAALAAGKTKYTPADGIPELKALISKYYQSDYGLKIDAKRIFITAGGSGGLLLATSLTLNPGETLLMTDPGYPCNRHFLKCFSSEAILVPVNSEDNYQLQAHHIETYWEASTRGVMLASPANPTGAILGREELGDIIQAVQARAGHVIVDEIYHGLEYDAESKFSALSISDDIIVLNSFSKYFGMTGWRLGWLVVPEDAIPLVEKLAQNLFICASSVAQYAALAAFTEPARREMDQNRIEFCARRDYLAEALRHLGFGVSQVPAGAFYVYARIPDGFANSETFCHWLLEKHGVAVTPGTDFGFFEADRHVRFSYAQNLGILKRGVEMITHALAIRDI